MCSGRYYSGSPTGTKSHSSSSSDGSRILAVTFSVRSVGHDDAEPLSSQPFAVTFEFEGVVPSAVEFGVRAKCLSSNIEDER